MAKSKRQRWIDEIAAFAGGRKPTCPVCSGHSFNHGYIESNLNDHIGWGAVWCEDCRSAFWISRVILTDETLRKKIVPALPDDLKFV